jgi:hypothetical protein
MSLTLKGFSRGLSRRMAVSVNVTVSAPRPRSDTASDTVKLAGFQWIGAVGRGSDAVKSGEKLVFFGC